MFNLVIILLSTINTEPKDSNNYKIAKYIIENLHTLEDCTITELSRNCYVSSSSISRFCRDIGLSDLPPVYIINRHFIKSIVNSRLMQMAISQ